MVDIAWLGIRDHFSTVVHPCIDNTYNSSQITTLCVAYSSLYNVRCGKIGYLISAR